MGTRTLTTEHRSSKDLLHHPLELLHEVYAAFVQGREAHAAYNAHVSEGAEAATAAARAVLDRRAA